MVNLGFDVFPFVLTHACNVNFTVKVADVADDGFVFHANHVIVCDHIDVAGCCDKNICFICGPVHGDDSVTFHSGLQGANRIDFYNPNLSGKGAKSLGAALAHIAVADNNGNFAGDHDIGGAFNSIDQRLTAAIEVIEFGFCDRIVDIHRREAKRALSGHLIQAVNAGCSLFADAFDMNDAL